MPFSRIDFIRVSELDEIEQSKQKEQNCRLGQGLKSILEAAKALCLY